jgi:hypothetical protein
MSRSSYAYRILTRLAVGCWMVVGIAVIGLISEGIGIVQQLPVQRGIDAHTVTLVGTYTDRIRGSGWLNDDTYILSYVYDGQDHSTQLRGLPGNPKLGDRLCVEIDATRPDHGRVCGTRGGLGDAESGLIWGGSIIAVAGAVIIFSRWWTARRRQLWQELDGPRWPERPFGSVG